MYIMKKIIVVITLMLVLALSVPVHAGYVPKEYKDEAKTIKNDADLYKFAV